jgi:carbon-monoxide dehydrogenase medium subunit
MKPAPFTLHSPKTIEDAVAQLAEFADEGGLVLAGGQSLVPMMALRVAYPPHLVDINGIESLRHVRVEEGHLVIGATVRHARFHRPVEDGCLGALLAAVSRNIAHYPIRHRGTFCGSLAHSDPSSEWCLVTRTLDGEMELSSQTGKRVVAAADYFLGAMTTAREPEEILTQVRLPLLPAGSVFGFYEFNRRAGDFAIGMCLAVLELREGVMRNVRIGVGGIEECPRRFAEAEEILEGKKPDEAVINEAAEAAAQAADPLEDAATSAQYRRDLAAVVIRRALNMALASPAAE